MEKALKHKFIVGETVLFTASNVARPAASGTYEVIRQLPTDGDDFQYRIKNSAEAFERVAGACRSHGKVLGVGGIRHNVELQGELIRLGARFVIAGTDVNYVLAGARQDTTALRAIPLG